MWWLQALALAYSKRLNYIEHYGLQRKEFEPGKLERAMPNHSWYSSHVIGRLMLFELSRHSDHHFIASRKYQYYGITIARLKCQPAIPE